MNDLHKCSNPSRADYYEKRGLWGTAVGQCVESEDGQLWVDNGEYGSQVNFCPFCGYEARVKINEDEKV